MSDLISRSKVISVLEQLEEHSLTGKMHISNAIHLLNNQPIAYDIDNVVVELNELDVKAIKRYKNGNFGDYEGNDYYIKKSKAIEIVKQGSVYDNVCEYKIKDKVIYASCNNKQIASAFCWFNECGDYKYCPYCGKRIKVVE